MVLCSAVVTLDYVIPSHQLFQNLDQDLILGHMNHDRAFPPPATRIGSMLLDRPLRVWTLSVITCIVCCFFRKWASIVYRIRGQGHSQHAEEITQKITKNNKKAPLLLYIDIWMECRESFIAIKNNSEIVLVCCRRVSFTMHTQNIYPIVFPILSISMSPKT